MTSHLSLEARWVRGEYTSLPMDFILKTFNLAQGVRFELTSHSVGDWQPTVSRALNDIHIIILGIHQSFLKGWPTGTCRERQKRLQFSRKTSSVGKVES